MKYYSTKGRQAGMTLIELTVVLLVLIGLAGLMIPYVAGFVSKTHDGTGDSNIARLNSTIQRFQATAMKFPNDLQNLTDSTGATYSKLMNTDPAVYVPVDLYKDGAASGFALKSLKQAGITSIMDLNTTGPSATFNVATGVNPINIPSAITKGTSVYALKVGKGAETNPKTDAYGSIELHLADSFGMQAKKFNATCNDYIILGVGQENEMVGKAMSDAPVHFAKNGNMGPDKKYNRYVAIFEVPRTASATAALATDSHPYDANGTVIATATGTGTATATGTGSTVDCSNISGDVHPAKFIGTAMLMSPPHLWGLAHSLGHTYNNIANGN